MPKHTGVLAHHNTTGTVTAKGSSLDGKLTVYGMNGVLLRSIEADQLLTFTGPVKRLGRVQNETVEVMVMGTTKMVSKDTGVDVTLHVADAAAFKRMQELKAALAGRLKP